MRFVVKSNQNITPLCQDKDLYHLVLEPEAAEELNYQPGDWLTLQFANQAPWVESILQALSLSGAERIELRRVGAVTARQALMQHLEISQLNPAILNKLQRQHQLGEWPDRQAMMDFSYGRDVFDLFNLFPQLKDWGVEFLSLLAPLAPRYYSIASAPVAVGDEVHLVVKQVVYQNADDHSRLHYGVASTAISQLQAGDPVEGELKNNPTFQLPEDSSTPIIMMGAGTGIAPYIGFLQQRLAQSGAGKNTLFFGETEQACSFLFKDYLNACVTQEDLSLFTAFSRDQAEKVYVQHRLLEKAEFLWQQVEQGAHLYICGSQYGLAEDVKAAWLKIIMQFEQVGLESAEQIWQDWRKQKRLQMDVY